MKKRILLVAIFMLALLFFVACGDKTNAAGTIEVKVYDVESVEVFKGNIKFSEEDTLEELLKNHEKIKMKGETSSFGFYIVEMVGVNANDHENTFWNIKVNGEDSMVGVSELDLVDKDVIEFRLISWME